ncbi:MAG: hypothetical protein PHW63_10415 [Alphaproteobacteria bacterium]|nr:hypothetical protein [Alphaproteobacteria bacterium]
MTSPDSTTMTPTQAYDFAQQVLSYIEEAGLEHLVDLPTSRYVTTGEPVYDCEQVVVTIVSLQTGLPEGGQSSTPQAISCQDPWSLVMDIGIVRCGPRLEKNGTISHQALSGAAYSESIDSDVLMTALDSIAQDSISSVRAAITYGAYEGGFIATTMRLTAALA